MFENTNIILFLLLALTCVFAEKFRFDNYTLYKIYPKNLDEVSLLQNLQMDTRFDFWTDPTPSSKFINIMCAPENKMELETFFSDNDFTVEVTMPNIQEHIEKQTVRRYARNNIRSMGWDAYYTLDDIYAWLDDLATTYPSIVTVIIGGSSYEGRQIKGIKISHGSGRRSIFVEGGIHSREWISPSTVNFIASELLTSDDAEIQAAARDYDWYIFPVTNPDGYIWSHESFRMWRKNRRPITSTAIGVDLNRNWNSNWLVAGASTNPALDIYAGPGPFSEIETRSLSSFIRSIGDTIDIYLSVHSYSQLLLVPFGNSTAAYANYYEAMNVGRRAMGALAVRYGTEYITGNIAEAIYMATGGSDEWVKEQLNVPLVYCYELRDLGQYGFLLPTDQILPNNQETMDSVVDLIYQGRRFGVIGGAMNLQVSLGLLVLVALVVIV